MARSTLPQSTLQRLPKKWAVAIVVVFIVYALVQPLANRRLGWSLPGLASMLGMQQSADNPPSSPSSRGTEVAPQINAPATEREQDEAPDPGEENIEGPSATAKSAAKPASNSRKSNSEVQDVARSTRSKTVTEPPDTSASQTGHDTSDLLYGLLKNAGREVYISPAGLRYTRGSEEGHRLKHLERHLADMPDRPGKHGVFDGDMPQALRWIDDAYQRGQQGAKGVRKRDEDGRTVFEVPFSKPIGYIGGRDGKRDHNPDSMRLRLVVEGDKIITAFPF